MSRSGEGSLPRRATQWVLDWAQLQKSARLSYSLTCFVSFPTKKMLSKSNNFNALQNGTTFALA